MPEQRMSDRVVTIVITVLITGALGLIGSALAGGALINVLGGVTKTEFDKLAAKVDNLPSAASSASIPIGAVAAFDSPDACPDGWMPFKDAGGRVIVGAGPGIVPGTDLADSEVETKKYRQHGGAETHTLTEAEMPAHNHAAGDFKHLLILDGGGIAAPYDIERT